LLFGKANREKSEVQTTAQFLLEKRAFLAVTPI
jgi:hypothetical protein